MQDYDLLGKNVETLLTQFERYDLSEIANIVGVKVSERSMNQSVVVNSESDVIEIVLNDDLSDTEKRRWFLGVLVTIKGYSAKS